MRPANTVDIGHGHSIRFVEYEDDLRTAIDDYHLNKDGKECGGFIAFKDGAWANSFKNSSGEITTWDVISLEPLTLSPSILCRACGDHGFIRDGKWVPA